MLTLQTQLSSGKASEAKPKVETLTVSPEASTSPPAPVAAPIPDTITTIYGKTYTGCVLSHMTPDGISFTHSTGVATVLFTDLDPAFAAKFGYDPAAAKQYELAEAARMAESDAIRTAAETPKKSGVASGAYATSAPVPANAAAQAEDAAQSDQALRAAKMEQIAALQSQITSLQNEAQGLEAQDVANFNSYDNIYYNSSGDVEHHSTMGHSSRAQADRQQIAVLQGQIAALQN